MSRHKWGDSNVDSAVYDIARGLYDSKVSVKRPPTAAQHGVYAGSCRGPPSQAIKGIKPRAHSAKPGLTSGSSTTVSSQKNPWRPFSGHAALNRPTPFLAAEYANVNKGGRYTSTAPKETELHCGVTLVPDVYQDRALPDSLVSLRDWLTENVPDNWQACYKPKHSFVFLPCVQSGDCVELPRVPPLQKPDDLLIYNPVQQAKKYKPPKPRLRQFLVDEDKAGKHCDHTNATSKLGQMPSHGSSFIDDICQGKRTADIIKQEIEDLERLLQGIGNPTGSSLVVRYQHDINHLRNMVKTTLEGYEFPEDARQCLTPVAASFQEDLVRYPEQHEWIFKTIKQRRDQCVQELADIEQEIMSKIT